MKLRAYVLGPTGFALCLLLSAACSNGGAEPSQTQASPLIACVDPGAPVAPGTWVCGADRTIECQGPQGADAGTLLVFPIALGDAGTAPDCNAVTFTPSIPVVGPYPVGDHTVTVREDTQSSSGVVCTSTFHVVDTIPPVTAPRDTFLWPPNHTMHDVAISDCVNATDVCDAAVKVSFTWVSSDESPTVNGSGQTSPDVEVVDCGRVRVRSERAGGSVGRVYRLGYEAVDHSGNRTTGSCRVIVAHDQSARTAVGGVEAYRVPVDTTGCL